MEKKIRRTYGYTNVQLLVILLTTLGLNLFSMLMLIETRELLAVMFIVHIVISVILSFLVIDLKEELWNRDEDKILPEAFMTGIFLAFPLSLLLPYVWTKVDKIKDLINRL